MREVGRYEVIGELGRGGMAVVYRARDSHLDREVALKVLGLEAGDELTRRFEREARAAASTQHPHVLPVYDHGVVGGRLYLAMALAAGGDLRSRLDRSGSLDVREAVELVAQLASAVQAIHEQGVLHRDLKPENVLFMADGRAVLADLGLAKFVDAKTQLTQTGEVLGTPNYMAPEQAMGEESTPATDVYGLGALLYRLLAGRPPHQGASVLQLLDSIVSTSPPSVRSLREDGQVDANLDRVVMRCLQREPAARFATAREVEEALRAWCESEPAAPRQSRGRALVLVAVALAAVGLAVALALSLSLGEGASSGAGTRDAAEPESYQLTFAWQGPAPEGWVLGDLAAGVRLEPSLWAGHSLAWVAREPRVRRQDRIATASLAPFRAPEEAGSWEGVVLSRASASEGGVHELTFPLETAARVQGRSAHVAVLDAEGRCLSLGPEHVLELPPAWWAELSPQERPPAIPEDLTPLADERGCYRNDKDESVLQWIPRGPTRWFSGREEQAVVGGGVFLGREPVRRDQARRFLLEVKPRASGDPYAALLEPAPSGEGAPEGYAPLPWLSALAYCRWAGGRLPRLSDTARAHWGDVPNRRAVPERARKPAGPFGTRARQQMEFCLDASEGAGTSPMARWFWVSGINAEFSGPIARPLAYSDAVYFRLCVDAEGRTRAPVPTWDMELSWFQPRQGEGGEWLAPEPSALTLIPGPPLSTKSFLRPWAGERERWARLRAGALREFTRLGKTAGLAMRGRADVSLRAGRWTVAALADDGLRLSWSGSKERLIDDWTWHGAHFYLVSFTVPADGVYRFELDYCDLMGGAALRVVIFPE